MRALPLLIPDLSAALAAMPAPQAADAAPELFAELFAKLQAPAEAETTKPELLGAEPVEEKKDEKADPIAYVLMALAPPAQKPVELEVSVLQKAVVEKIEIK